MNVDLSYNKTKVGSGIVGVTKHSELILDDGNNPHSTNLNDITDVDLTTPPLNNQVLKYDSLSGTWSAENEAVVGGDDSLNLSLGEVFTNGNATSGYLIINNEITLNIQGGNPGKSRNCYWQFVVPKSYNVNGSLSINLRTTNTLITAINISAFVNGVIDANLNSFNIIPNSNNVFELKNRAFATTLNIEDLINVYVYVEGLNGDDVDIKSLYFNYSK